MVRERKEAPEDKAAEKRTDGRDKAGRFAKGVSGNPRGRAPLPEQFKKYAAQAPERLREICEAPDTPVKVRADIERWFAEMWYGKAPQAVAVDGRLENTGTTVVRFEGVLKEWSE